jgi:hypothetical protein
MPPHEKQPKGGFKPIKPGFRITIASAASHSLSGFQRAVILQEIRDSGRTERLGEY